MTDTGNVYGTPSRDNDQTLVGMPVPPLWTSADKWTPEITFGDKEEDPLTAPFPHLQPPMVANNDTPRHIAVDSRDEEDRSIRATTSPPFNSHEVLDHLLASTQFAIRVHTKAGRSHYGRWYDKREYDVLWERFAEAVRIDNGNGFFTLMLEEGIALIRMSSIESITYFSREWHDLTDGGRKPL